MDLLLEIRPLVEVKNLLLMIKDIIKDFLSGIKDQLIMIIYFIEIRRVYLLGITGFPLEIKDLEINGHLLDIKAFLLEVNNHL